MGSICILKYKILFGNTKYSIFKSILNTFFAKYLYFKYFLWPKYLKIKILFKYFLLSSRGILSDPNFKIGVNFQWSACKWNQRLNLNRLESKIFSDLWCALVSLLMSRKLNLKSIFKKYFQSILKYLKYFLKVFVFQILCWKSICILNTFSGRVFVFVF